MGIDSGYLIPLGALKVVEILCLLIGFSTVESTISEVSVGDRGWRYNFHIAICIIAWLYTIIWFIVSLFCLIKRENIVNIITAVAHFILGILALAAASALLDKYLEGEDLAKKIAKIMGRTFKGSDELKAGCAFGIISGLLLIADGILHIVFKKGGRDSPVA